MPGICERCKKSVFHAEEIKAIGKSWHHQCFVCANHGCRKSLDSMNVTERNGEAFCKSCYARSFGPKGYGYAMGAAGSLTLSPGLPLSSIVQPSSKCKEIKSNISTECTTGTINEESIRCSELQSHSQRPFWSPSVSAAQKEGYLFTTFQYGGDICPRCNKKVYAAERVLGAGSEQPWHQTCFKCNNCNKLLDSVSVTTYKKEVYCKTCHNRYHYSNRIF